MNFSIYKSLYNESINTKINNYNKIKINREDKKDLFISWNNFNRFLCDFSSDSTRSLRFSPIL